MRRLGRLYRFFCQAKQLEHFDTHFMVRTLKSAFMPNFSQIGEVKWPRFFLEKFQTIVLKSYSLDTTISLFIGLASVALLAEGKFESYLCLDGF